ncbi:MAG TPA: PqqD family peptide modification chaperone [Candidatus Cloacimonetes bacterium]|nr:PqqD family peptide modification chaperone [Candidatus Cloacimonadota bacterium]
MNVEKLNSLAISETGFIFDPTSGHSFTTNEVGIEIITLLKAGKEIQEIIEELQEEYAVSENELEIDVMDYIHNLKNYYLV